MKLVIIGEGPKLPSVKEKLTQAGIELLTAGDAQELKEIVPTLSVLIYVRSELPQFIQDNDYRMQTVRALPPGDEIVILLDAVRENRPYDFSMVFEAARRAALMQRRVSVLSRSVRCSYPGAEAKYTAAREAGVRFIKYDDINIQENESGTFTVTATDDADTLTIETSCLVDCSPGSEKKLLEIAKVLKLKTYKGRYITGGRWFEAAKNTSRRNVYVLFESEIGPDGDLGTLVVDLLANTDKERNYIAMVDKNKCAFCYTCYRICPHSAPIPDLTARAMLITQELCMGCGACIAACPAAAIAWDEPIGEVNPKAPILVLGCEHSGYVAAMSALKDMDVEIQKLPCGGVISPSGLAQNLKDHKGVLVGVCIDGACQHYEGNMRAAAAVKRTKAELEQLGLNPDRLELIQVSGSMENIIRDAVESFQRRLDG